MTTVSADAAPVSASRTRTARRTGERLPPTLVTHHPLDHALTGFCDLSLFAQAVSAVLADLACLATDLHRNELRDLVVALATCGHTFIIYRVCLHAFFIERRKGGAAKSG